MPSRFTKIYGTPAWVSTSMLVFFGSTCFKVAFAKQVDAAIHTIKDAKNDDVNNDPLADINWVTPRIPRLILLKKCKYKMKMILITKRNTEI